jgi:hypothetical protein
MSDVIDMRSFRAKAVEPPPARKRSRGLGVLISPPGSTSAFGVLGGNIGVRLPRDMAFDPEFDLGMFGRDIREAKGVALVADEAP